MHQHPVPLLHDIRFLNERKHRQPTQKRRHDILIRNRVGDLDRVCRGGGRILRIPTGPHPGNAISNLEVARIKTWAQRDDGPGPFAAEHLGLWGRIQPRAEVRVDVVDAADGIFHEHLALLRSWDGVVRFELEDFRATGLFDQDGLHCGGERHCRAGSGLVER